MVSAIIEVTRHDGQRKVLSLSQLELARITAFRNGFEDVDVEPTGNGAGCRITCKSKYGLSSISVTGDTQALACEKLVERLW